MNLLITNYGVSRGGVECSGWEINVLADNVWKISTETKLKFPNTDIAYDTYVLFVILTSEGYLYKWHRVLSNNVISRRCESSVIGIYVGTIGMASTTYPSTGSLCASHTVVYRRPPRTSLIVLHWGETFRSMGWVTLAYIDALDCIVYFINLKQCKIV